jgi:hypothetical protein
VVEREADVDALLAGWSERRTDPDGLSWVLGGSHRWRWRPRRWTSRA